MSFTEKIDVLELLVNIIKENEDKLETLISGAGLGVEDEQFDSVWDRFDQAYYQDGPKGFDIAEKRLERILSKTKPEKKVL